MLQKCASGSVGGARPCQGRGRGFESRLALFLFYSGNPFIFMRVSAIFVTGHSYTFSFSREYFTMIQKVSSFLKKDTVLTIALALAVLSMFIIPPSAGYLGYLDLHTLILLFGLMTATTGLQNIGFFRQLGELLLLRIHIAPFLVWFYRQSVFPRLLVSTTYTQVLKHLVCVSPCKVSVPAFQKFPTSLLLRGKTYIP